MSDSERSIRVIVAESVGGTGSAVDCVVAGHRGTTLGEVVEIGAAGELWPRPIVAWVASSDRSGARAEADEPLELLRLAHGDTVRIEAADRTLAGAARARLTEGATHELAVSAGPSSGLRIPLGDGALSVGRGAGCDLTLDDPSLSGRHFRLEPGASGWSVVDDGSSNGTAVDGVRLKAGIPALLADGAEIEAGRSLLTLRPVLPETPIEASLGEHGEIGVNRPPRMLPAVLDATVDAPQVPEKPKGMRLPVIVAVVPLIGGIVMWQLLDQIMFLAFTLLSPVMLVGNWVSDRMNGRSDFNKAIEKLVKEQDEISTEVAGRLAAERIERRDRYPDAAEVVRRVMDTDRRLWERRPHHVDHLGLRLGLADLPSHLVVNHPKRGDEELRAQLADGLPERATLINVPAVLELADVSVVGITGPPAERAALTRWLAVQVAALHSPRDVQLAAIVDPQDAGAYEWMKWLPHTAGSSLEEAGAGAIATTRLGTAKLVDAVTMMAAQRAAQSGSALSGARRHGPDLVLLVQDAGVNDPAAMAHVLTMAPTTGVQVLWEAESSHQLPGECRVIIDIDASRARAKVTDTVTGQIIQDVTLDGLSLPLTERIATSLAPLRDVTQADRGVGALPSIAHLADLERLMEPSPDAILGRWAVADGPATFTLGGGPAGPLVLDMVEHGPHALVGGTPGAGKSELLRGILASLAVRYPPSRMTFLLVDFKGGAAFREFAPMPHTVGIVTDLDEHLADRALTSFRAEIKYREHVLEEHGAIDVLDLARRAPDVVLPRLLIVIDEFATLAQEVPAFVDGVIDVTQRGRSLGVHLILATQSPRGSVTGKIRANTNLAIALRVVSADESNDILGTGDAAAIPVSRKGRAWARIGDKDLVPFQSGYVGASTFGTRGKTTSVRPFRVTEAPPAPRAPEPDPGPELDADASRPVVTTDLEAIAEGVIGAFATTGEPEPRAPWLPELPEILAFPDDRERGAFGLSDEPARQRQVQMLFSPEEDGSIIVLGGPRSGKTSTLAIIAGTLAEDRTPAELNVYGLDCAGRSLSAIEPLPHTGAVVPGDDQERTGHLLGMLTRTIQARRDAAGATGAADFDALRERSEEPMPRLLVLLDDYGGFYERYERVESGRMLDQMRQLISDGPAFGVHFVLSADRRSAIPTSVAAAIPRRLIHRMADRDEYARVGLPTRLASVDVPPGRAFTGDAVEVQVASWLDGPEDTLRAAFTRRGEALAARFEAEGETAKPVGVAMLPGLVKRSDGPAELPEWHAFAGLLETDLVPAIIDLTHANAVIAGSYRSGRSTTLAALANGIKASTPDVEIHLVAPRRTAAEERAEWDSVTRGSEHAPVVELLNDLIDKADAGTPAVLCIDDATEIDPTGMSGLERLLRQSRDLPLRIVIAAEAQALRTSYSPWHVQMRKDGLGILLNPNLELDGDLLGVRLPWRRSISFPPGRGMFIDGGAFDVIQVVGDGVE
ncbi:MAG: FtsK/SpoIIIE domain-containing protein [Solirubrobacteraceae bacterium]|nr:FtsK/SpoIIIE domain-containing protein [Solirubrobacteraceae bacterium]